MSCVQNSRNRFPLDIGKGKSFLRCVVRSSDGWIEWIGNRYFIYAIWNGQRSDKMNIRFDGIKRKKCSSMINTRFKLFLHYVRRFSSVCERVSSMKCCTANIKGHTSFYPAHVFTFVCSRFHFFSICPPHGLIGKQNNLFMRIVRV